MTLFIGIIEQGLLYAPLALGLYIAYQILDFPDLTVDGSFPLGAAVTAAIIASGGNPFLALIASLLAGAVAGILTGTIHVRLGVKDLLAGLIMQTALYTINLLITGQSNLPTFNAETIFTMHGLADFVPPVLIMAVIVILVKFALDYFLDTKLGFLLKACGDNPQIVKSLAQNPGLIKIRGLALSNALVALSGSLVAQHQKFFEISMGMGAMVMALASVVLGMKLFERLPKVSDTTKVVIGSIVYKASIALTIAIGLPSHFMKLVTAVIFLVILITGNRKDGQSDSH